MTQNTIEIEVELKGQKDALKGLDKVKEGAEGIGETFKGASALIGKSNQQLGEGFNALSDAIGSSTSAVAEMGQAVQKVGQGGASFTALLGPIGLVAGALAAAVETFRQFSGAAKEAENREAAFGAAAGDLTSKLEALAEKGFVPATKELLAFSRANLAAQIQKELLTNQIEKISKALQAERDAQDQLAKAQASATKINARAVKDAREVEAANVSLRMAQDAVQATSTAVTKAFSGLAVETEKVNKQLAAVGETYKGFEKQTKEALETKAKELIAQRKTVEELQAEASGLKEATVLSMKRDAERRATANTLKLEGMTRDQLASFVKAQEAAVKALNVEALKDKKLAQQIARLSADKAKARQKETKAIDQQRLAQQALREEQMRLVKESQIRQLEIKLTEEGYAQQIALAQERYQLGLALAQEDALQHELVERQHDLAVKQIEDQRLAREQQAHDRSLEMLMSRLQKEDQLYDAQTQKVIQEQERAVRSFTSFLTELTKSTSVEIESSVVVLGGLIDDFGKQFARAGVEAILFGDVASRSMKEVTAQILKGLAIEAGVRAIMETAAAIASAAVGDAKGALGHGAAAATYFAVGGAAAAGASALGVGGGATGGTTASPTGAPQVAATPQREQADSREMVFNLNFGGAVIYDTKEAAKRAMIGDIVRTYNGNNRGMPRFNFAR